VHADVERLDLFGFAYPRRRLRLVVVSVIPVAELRGAVAFSVSASFVVPFGGLRLSGGRPSNLIFL
jgi:hypothetical protein